MANQKKKPLVVIFGRANVGKSTLFNCLTETRKALVASIEGTTRDSNRGEVSWRGVDINLIDSGGIINPQLLLTKKINKKNVEVTDIDIEVQKRVSSQLKIADLILFLTDSKTGPLPQDKQMILILKKILPRTDNIIMVANKADNMKFRRQSVDFYPLSFDGQVIPVSAATGSGTGDLLDIIVDRLIEMKKVKPADKEVAAEEAEPSINVCIAGKPNVGKSSLLNAILGEDRVIVSPIAHTTREPQDTQIKFKDELLTIVDTAGISKRGRQTFYHRKNFNTSKNKIDAIEKGGIARSIQALGRADVVLLVIDISKEITQLDAKIVEEIVNRKKSLIIIANKWDLIEEKDVKHYTDYIYSELPFIRWAPIHFTAAKSGSKVNKTLELIMQVREERRKNLSDSQLDKFLSKIVKIHRPSKGKGFRHPRVYEFRQTKIDPPEFEIQIGSREDVHFSYLRFMENRLREKFGYTGTPINIRVLKGKQKEDIKHEDFNPPKKTTKN